MNERIIVILETVAIVVLAIVIVIYAQVLWQQFQTAKQLEQNINTDTVVEEPAPGGATDEERMRVLEALNSAAPSAIAEEDRSRIFESLANEETAVEVDQETRARVLESLQAN